MKLVKYFPFSFIMEPIPGFQNPLQKRLLEAYFVFFSFRSLAVRLRSGHKILFFRLDPKTCDEFRVFHLSVDFEYAKNHSSALYSSKQTNYPKLGNLNIIHVNLIGI